MIKNESAFSLSPLNDIHDIATKLATIKTKYDLKIICLRLILFNVMSIRITKEK
jgi:hypothetical protein